MKSPILCRIGLHKLNKYTYVPLLCRLGLHSPCKTEYIEVTRRRSDRHGGKYHTNYAVCERCGRLCYRVKLKREGM